MSDIVTPEWDDYLQQVHDAWAAGSAVQVVTGPGALHNYAALVDGGSGGGEPVPTPLITLLDPDAVGANEPGGYTMKVIGSGFTRDAVVELDQVPAVETTYVTQGFLQAVFATGAPADVEVTVRQGEQESNPVTLRVVDLPTLTSIVPDTMPMSAPTTLTLTGTGFTPTTRVSMPYAAWEGGTNTVVSTTQITYAFTPAAASVGDVIVIDDDTELASSNRLPITVTAAAGDES